jgi:hypothetical protein
MKRMEKEILTSGIRLMLLWSVCFALAACSTMTTTTGTSIRSKTEAGEILYQVNEEPAWLTEAELISRLGMRCSSPKVLMSYFLRLSRPRNGSAMPRSPRREAPTRSLPTHL